MSELNVPEEKVSSDSNNNDGDDSGGGSTSDGICRDYQRGVCNRGGKCKFKHPEGMGTELQSPPMICRDFQNGKCSRSTCKYMHISNADEKVYLRTGMLPPSTRSRYGPPPGGPPMGGGPMRSSGGYGGYGQMPRGAPGGNRGDPICKDFLNNKCSRANCRFRHAFEDDQGYGGGYGGGMDDFSRKRRRDSSGDGGDYGRTREENESLYRQVADLQKQIADLKATNEVLLEQNARYRNQAGGSSASNSSSYYSSTKPASTSGSADYTSSYPPNDSYGSGSYGAKGPAYAASTTTSYTPSAGTSSYASTSYTPGTTQQYGTGTGYTKFE